MMRQTETSAAHGMLTLPTGVISKMRPSILRWSKWIVLLICLCVLVVFAPVIWFQFFGGDYAIELPKGFSIDRVYAGANLLVNPRSEIIVAPNIDGYQVTARLIFGHVSDKNLLGRDSIDSRPGFFILNMDTDSLVLGLEEARWLDELKKMGVVEKPILKEPSRFDRNVNQK